MNRFITSMGHLLEGKAEGNGVRRKEGELVRRRYVSREAHQLNHWPSTRTVFFQHSCLLRLR